MSNLFILVAIVSVVYVFDVAAYPFIHVPLYILTGLYFASVLEMYGVTKVGSWIKRRFNE